MPKGADIPLSAPVFLISFCNLGIWCSRYCLGLIGDDFSGFAWLDCDGFVLPDADTGATGLACVRDGVLVCLQSRAPRLVRLDPDLRPRQTYLLTRIRDPHSVAVRGDEALIACAASNRLFAVDLRTGTERCVFVAHAAEHDVVHLNGVTLWQGQPLVSMFGPLDPGGARLRGSVLDVERGDIVAEALAEPHSPRVQGATLHVLCSAAGELLRSRDSSIERLPIGGYLRGLAVEAGGVVVGRSAWRAGRRRLGRTPPPGTGGDPHGHAWQRSALIRERDDGTVTAADLSRYGPELYDILRLERAPAAARLFHDAAERRLDALQEAQLRLAERA